jgi:type IV pilus assembly protein PilM
MENMFNFNYPEENQMVSLIKVGATETNVQIIENGFNIFRRDITIGGVNITEEISKKFQIDFNEAENIKIGGIKHRDANFQTNYMIYINMIIARITSEIQRTIDYFAANNDKQYPKKIFLTGGSSKLQGLSEDIETKLNIPVTIVNPFRHIVFKPGIVSPEGFDAESSMFCVAVGLAVRGFEV